VAPLLLWLHYLSDIAVLSATPTCYALCCRQGVKVEPPSHVDALEYDAHSGRAGTTGQSWHGCGHCHHAAPPSKGRPCEQAQRQLAWRPITTMRQSQSRRTPSPNSHLNPALLSLKYEATTIEPCPLAPVFVPKLTTFLNPPDEPPPSTRPANPPTRTTYIQTNHQELSR
jgi:hypothetical protein